MPAYGHLGNAVAVEELTASQVDIDSLGLGTGTLSGGSGATGRDAEEVDSGVLSVGWDMEDEVVQVQEKGWLEEDDIDDFD